MRLGTQMLHTTEIAGLQAQEVLRWIFYQQNVFAVYIDASTVRVHKRELLWIRMLALMLRRVAALPACAALDAEVACAQGHAW